MGPRTSDARTPGAGKHNIEIVRKCSRRRMRLVSRMFLTVATESRGTLVFCCEEYTYRLLICDNCARSCGRRRATIGIVLFPSLKVPTGAPLIAAADELATSAFVMLTRFARSGSISIFTCSLAGPESSLHTASQRDYTEL